jgi:hypothetical protein
VLEGIYQVQQRQLLLAKANLDRMPDPSYFLDTALLILLDIDMVKNDTQASHRIGNLQKVTAELTAHVKSATQNAEQCMERLLEFEAGMLCLACSATHDQYLQVVDELAILRVNISMQTRNAILGSCCELATDVADVIDLVDSVRNSIVNESDSLGLSGASSMSFLSHLNFPKSSYLRRACPSKVVEKCRGSSPVMCALHFQNATLIGNSTEHEKAAELFVSTMANGVDKPGLPAGFEADSFVHTGFGTISREKRVRCKAAPSVAEDMQAETKISCNRDCNKEPKFCPSALCDCRLEPIVRNDTEYKVVGTTILGGFSQPSDFTASHQLSFRVAIGTVAGVDAEQVSIVNVTVASSDRRSSRELASDSIQVESEVTSSSHTEAARVKASLDSAASNSTAINTAFGQELVSSGTSSEEERKSVSVAVVASSVAMEVTVEPATKGEVKSNYTEGLVQTSFDNNGYDAVAAGADSSLTQEAQTDDRYLGVVPRWLAWSMIGLMILTIIVGTLRYIRIYICGGEEREADEQVDEDDDGKLKKSGSSRQMMVKFSNGGQALRNRAKNAAAAFAQVQPFGKRTHAKHLDSIYKAPDYTSIQSDISHDLKIVGEKNILLYISLMVNYVWTWRLHGMRSLLTDSIIHDASSPSEKSFLRDNCGIAKDMQTARNILVWRRSSMWIMLVPNLISAIMQLLAVLHHWEAYKTMEKMSTVQVNVQDYDVHHGVENMEAYTSALLVKSVAGVYLGVKFVTFVIQSVLVSFAWVAFVANAVALYRWDNYHFSRYMLLFGWLGMFLGPFFVSLVPNKNFLRWENWELTDDRVDEIYSLEVMGFRGGVDYVYDKEALKLHLENSKLMMELTVGILNSLVVFTGLMPACLALGPALVRASKVVKKMVPESTFPPVITLLVPVLFTPLAWSIYNIV